AHGYDVRVFDNLCNEVHGHKTKWPPYLSSDVELIVGDIQDAEAVKKAVRGVDAVFHFAGMVGAAQSMYEIRRYTSVNNLGTAILMESLIQNPVERLIVASSMSIYGEGSYTTLTGETISVAARNPDQLRRQEWDLIGQDGEQLIAVPTA